MTQVRYDVIKYKASLINLRKIPSEPTERVSLRLFTVHMNVLVSTGLGLNFSVTLLHFTKRRVQGDD